MVPRNNCEQIKIVNVLKLNGLHFNSIENNNYFTPELKQLLHQGKYDVICRRLQRFKEKLNAFYPITNFNPYVNMSYILLQNGKNLYYQLSQFYSDEAAPIYAKIKLTEYNHAIPKPLVHLNHIDTQLIKSNLEEMTEHSGYTFSDSRVQIVNSALTGKHHNFGFFTTILIFSLLLAYFLIQFQFIEFVNFVIFSTAAILFVFAIFLLLITSFGDGSLFLIAFYLLILLLAT